jgi:thioredoxin 1
MAKYTLHKYGHEYCSPCRQMAPILAQLATEKAELVTVVDHNTMEENPNTLSQLGIKAVPTFILHDENGNEIWRHVGMTTKENLISKLV